MSFPFWLRSSSSFVHSCVWLPSLGILFLVTRTWSLSASSIRKLPGFVHNCTRAVMRIPFLRNAHGKVVETWQSHYTRSLRAAKRLLEKREQGHPVQTWITQHATLHGHVLRHSDAFRELLDMGSPAELALRRL
eukprot:2227744-Amphidinium_carterae.1